MPSFCPDAWQAISSSATVTQRQLYIIANAAPAYGGEGLGRVVVRTPRTAKTIEIGRSRGDGVAVDELAVDSCMTARMNASIVVYCIFV